MRPHPRVRKAVKWGGAVLSGVLVAVWAASAWWAVVWWNRHGDHLAVLEGQLYVGLKVKPPGAGGGEFATITPAPRLIWSFGSFEGRNGVVYCVPLWACVAPAVLLTATAWRLDTVARRRTHSGHCPCGYDLTGIPPGQPCPECGCVWRV